MSQKIVQIETAKQVALSVLKRRRIQGEFDERQ